VHDRQSLADTLEGYAKLDTIETAQVELIRGLLEREVMQLHTQYLARRASLREACAQVEYAVSRAWRPGPAIAVGAALAVSGVLVGRHGLAGHATES
jgi:hypothetical protein